jgi:hypothetical protein
MAYHERPSDFLHVLTCILIVGMLIVGMVLLLGWANGLKP